MSHTPLPWRITEPTEKKTREIVGANGETVARLTALDMENAELIVACVNACTRQRSSGAAYIDARMTLA